MIDLDGWCAGESPGGYVTRHSKKRVAPGLDLHSVTSTTRERACLDRCKTFVQEISQETQTYLVGLFQRHCNSHVILVQRDAVPNDEDTMDLYPRLLHIAMMAVGLRYADPESRELGDLKLTGRESFLHRELRAIVEKQQPTSASVVYVQVLLLLADLEYGCGRVHIAHLYRKMACKTMNVIASSKAESDLAVSDDEIITRRMVFRACKFLEQQWTFYQASNLFDNTCQIFEITPTSTEAADSRTSFLKKDTELQIYHAHLALLNLANRMVLSLQVVHDNLSLASFGGLEHAEKELQRWRNQLPDQLQQCAKPESASSCVMQ